MHTHMNELILIKWIMKSHSNTEKQFFLTGKCNTVRSSHKKEILASKAELCLVNTLVAMMGPAKHKSKKTNDSDKKVSVQVKGSLRVKMRRKF